MVLNLSTTPTYCAIQIADDCWILLTCGRTVCATPEQKAERQFLVHSSNELALIQEAQGLSSRFLVYLLSFQVWNIQ